MFQSLFKTPDVKLIQRSFFAHIFYTILNFAQEFLKWEEIWLLTFPLIKDRKVMVFTQFFVIVSTSPSN